ncbi:MAG: carboxypeptidase-like regulatory domain-containing protein [Deltaproteobacteria bacterium]|nr:carboxypeptidase-like regulatory domain-containing protein [Deltaproteobacteria bacterium]
MSLAIAAAGCGDDLASGTDAGGEPPADATPSARGTVTVAVVDPATGAPEVGAAVVFADPDGAIAARVVTNSDGRAHAQVLPGGAVTAVVTHGAATWLETVTAIEPGDDLVLDRVRPYRDPRPVGTFGVTYPDHPDAASYTFHTSCPGGDFAPGEPVVMTLHAACKRGVMDVLLIANDAAHAPVAYLDQRGVEYVADGSIALTGPWQPLRSVTATYAHVPAAIASIRAVRAVPDRLGYTRGVDLAAPHATATATFAAVLGASAWMRSELRSDAGSRQLIEARLDGVAQDYALDVGAALLPWVREPVFDPATGAFAIASDGDATADGALAAITYARGDRTFEWTVVAPDLADVRLPALPDELAALAPAAGDALDAPGAALLESNALADYAALRRGLGDLDEWFATRGRASRVRISSSPRMPAAAKALAD